MPVDPDSRAVQDALIERFLRYSRISSQSDAEAAVVPSSTGQRELAELLAAELQAAGAADVHLSRHGVLTARLPERLPAGHGPVPAIGFCLHLDTADVNLSPQVRAHVVEHDGGDVLLNPARALWCRVSEHPELARYAGDRLLVTDGTSVLGADDKAGIASVMEAATAVLQDEEAAHGEVFLCFVPDEEIGLRGVRLLDLERFPVSCAWTLDCCELGEAVWQTFNAASARIEVKGVPAHPMSAKGQLVNPILVAHDIIAGLDRSETPEMTEGTEGFVWVKGIEGNQSSASIDLLIRDHDAAGFDRKKELLHQLVARASQRSPRAQIRIEISDTYGNIADAVTPANRMAIDVMLQAMTNLGIEPRPLAMRGGTDGSWLSRQGILTPNFFTGAHNFHSTAEFLPVRSFACSHAVVCEIIRLVAERSR